MPSSPATTDAAVALWQQSLRDAYALARGERLNELNGRYHGRFDGRGLHPFSEAMGRVLACEALLGLDSELMTATANQLREQARQDAVELFKDQLVEELKERAARASTARGTG